MTLSPTTFNRAKVVSIKLFRARLLDELIGQFVQLAQGRSTNLPFDIDDLDVSDNTVLANLATADIPAVQATANMKSGSKGNALNWQDTTNPEDYKKRVAGFREVAKTEFTKKLGELAKQLGTGAAQNFEQAVQTIDITAFTALQGLSRDMTFGNTCTLTISSVELRKRLTQGIRENDVIEIIVEYPDGRLDRLFLGIVSGVSQVEQYGQITAVRVACSGISKFLQINRMVANRAAISQFEDGELAQFGFTPLAGGAFTGKSVDQIFSLIMESQLALKPIANTSQSPQTQLRVEQTVITKTQNSLDARIRELTKRVSPDSQARIERGVKSQEPTFLKPTADGLGLLPLSDLQSQVELAAPYASGVPAVATAGIITPPTPDENALYVNRLVSVWLGQRTRDITQALEDYAANAKTLTEYSANPKIGTGVTNNPKQTDTNTGGATIKTKVINIDFGFDEAVFPQIDEFQLTYIPLITLMAVKGRKFDPAEIAGRRADLVQQYVDDFRQVRNFVARFTGRAARVYDLLIKKTMELFFSQISTPANILDEVRTKAKFVVYENEANQVICEIPRYNEFGGNTLEGELDEDFIIWNASQLEVSRQDTDLISRQDVRAYVPFIGEAGQFGTLGMGQFTDIATLIKYGMRVDMPIYNPNASVLESRITPFLFAATELSDRNSTTRTMTATMAMDRRIRTGRLYFVARQSLDQVVGSAPSSQNTKPIDIQGYVGFLTACTINFQHGSVPTCTLTFQRVRKARLLPFYDRHGRTRYAANFRILPDIGGVIDALETASQNGSLNPGIFGPGLPENPAGATEIWTVNNPGGLDNGSRFYAARFQMAKVNAPWLSLGPKFFQTSTPNTKDTNRNAYHRWTSTSPWVTHHRALPPTSNPVDANKKPIDRVAVFRVDDGSAGLTQELIDRLGLLDLRLRSLNYVAFTEQLRPIIGPYGGLHLEPAFNADRLAMKRQTFRVLYVPSSKLNPYYRIAGLHGLTMSLIGINSSQVINHEPTRVLDQDTIMGKIPGTINLNSHPPLEYEQLLRMSPNMALLFEDYVVAAGAPFKVGLTSGSHFAILRLYSDGEVKLGQSKLLVTPSQLLSDAVRPYLRNLSNLYPDITAADVDRVLENFSNLPPDTQEPWYLPVVFHNLDPDIYLGHVDPGIPFSLYDIVYKDLVSPFTFPGYLELTNPEPGQEGIEHTQGKAIDLSLFPYWTKTGLTLKAQSPYPLSIAYLKAKPSNVPGLPKEFVASSANFPTSASFPNGNINDTSLTATEIDNIGSVGLTIVPKSSQEDQDVARNIFQQMILDLGLTEVLDFNNDLELNDKIFHHISSTGSSTASAGTKTEVPQ